MPRYTVGLQQRHTTNAPNRIRMTAVTLMMGRTNGMAFENGPA